MGMLCCAAKCCGCIVLSQLCALLLPLLLLAALAALFYLYAVPWGEEQIRDALGLASDVDIGDLNASYVAAHSCSGCVFGSNTQWPTNSTGALHFLDSQAGSTASTVIATSLAGAAAAGVGSMLWASFLPSAASALSFSSGFYEMTHIVEQAQFIGMISQLQIDGAPTFLYQFSKELSWTNFNIAKSTDSDDSSSSSSSVDDDDDDSDDGSSSARRRLADSSTSASGSGSTGAVAAAGETGPARYAALMGVDANDLFFYTLVTFAAVLGVLHVLFLLLVMVLGFASKKESFGDVARKWYRKVIWASVLALLLAQYMFAMAGCYFASEGSSGAASGSSTRYALGLVALAAVVLLALGLGILVVGNNTEELRDVGTYEHDQRPFSSKYSAYYDEYNFDNRFFFVPRILLAVATGAIVGVVRDATVQLLCIMGVTVLYLMLLLLRQPNLLRFLYYIGITSVFMKIVLICLMLVVARDDYFPQSVRDNVAYGIIGVNMFIFFLLFLRQVYTIVHKMVVACRNKKKGLHSDASDATDINLEVGNSTAAATTDGRGYNRIDSTTANMLGVDQPWDGGKHQHQQLYQQQQQQQQQAYNGTAGYGAYAQQRQHEPQQDHVPMLELSNSGVSTDRSNHQYQQQYQQQQQQQQQQPQQFKTPPPVSRNQQYSFGGSSRSADTFATALSQPPPQQEPQPQPAPVPQYDVLAAYLGTAKTQEEQAYSTSPRQSATAHAVAATRASLQPKRESRVSAGRGQPSYEGSFSGMDARANAAAYAGSFSGADAYSGSFSGAGSRGPRASQPQQQQENLQRSHHRGSVDVDTLNVDVDVDALDVDIDDDVVAEPPVPTPARQQFAAATAAADEIGSNRTRQSYLAFSDSTMSSGGSQPGSSRSGLAVESHASFEDADEKDGLGGMTGFHGSPQVKMSILSDGSDSFSGDSSDWFARRSKTELSAASSDDLDGRTAEGKSDEPGSMATGGQRGSSLSYSQSGGSYDSYAYAGSKASFMTLDSVDSGDASNGSSRGANVDPTSRSISYLDDLGDDKNDLGDDSDSDSDDEYYPTTGRDTNTSVQSFVSARSDDSVGFYFESERPTTVRADDPQTKKL